MTRKRIAVGIGPITKPGAERWIRRGEGARAGTEAMRADRYTARLTIDVSPELRGRIKVAAFRQDVTVADLLRTLFEREFRGSKDNA